MDILTSAQMAPLDLAALDSSSACEYLEWFPADGAVLPDGEITVLVALADDDEPTWLGFLTADGWRSASTGAPFAGQVTAWADMPLGPSRPKVSPR